MCVQLKLTLASSLAMGKATVKAMVKVMATGDGDGATAKVSNRLDFGWSFQSQQRLFVVDELNAVIDREHKHTENQTNAAAIGRARRFGRRVAGSSAVSSTTSSGV